jgi:hypothetical protein
MTIERGIPIPEKGAGSPTERKWPLADMQVGDSLFIPRKGRNKVNTMAYLQTTRGWRFVTRRERDGIRVWRTK